MQWIDHTQHKSENFTLVKHAHTYTEMHTHAYLDMHYVCKKSKPEQ